MEGEQKKTGWKIWIYFISVYIILAIPLVKWTQRINSSDVGLSKKKYNVFNASEGEVKKRKAQEDYDPGLTDAGYAVRYRPAGAKEGSLQGDGPSAQETERLRKEAAARARQQAAARQAGYEPKTSGQAALDSSSTRAKEQAAVGFKKGYLTTAIGKVMNNPKAVKTLLNNKYIVNGFMSRDTVKAATASPQGLANYLKGPGPSNFMNNPVVKAALNNPAIISAVASSGMVSAMLNTPAAQALMRDPDALAGLVDSNPQLVNLIMQNPQTLTTLMSNPEVSGVVGKFDTSRIQTR